MSSSSFHKLPVELYLSIQSYLIEYKQFNGHNNLMNSNKSIFTQIKYETIHYHIKCALCQLKLIEPFLLKVKNYRKQLNLFLYPPKSSHHEYVLYLEKIGLSSQTSRILEFGLAFLRFHKPTLNDICVSLFDNTVNLEIYGCDDMVILPSLRNVEILLLCDLPHLININSLNLTKLHGLKRVRLNRCNKLVDISVLFGISEVSIEDCSGVASFDNLGNHQTFDFTNQGYICTTNLNVFNNIPNLIIKCIVIHFILKISVIHFIVICHIYNFWKIGIAL
jgi:hypothetical protein